MQTIICLSADYGYITFLFAKWFVVFILSACNVINLKTRVVIAQLEISEISPIFRIF